MITYEVIMITYLGKPTGRVPSRAEINDQLKFALPFTTLFIIMLCDLTQGGLLEKPWKSPVERDALRLPETPVTLLENSWKRAGAIQTCHSYQ